MKYRTVIITKSGDEVIGAAEEGASPPEIARIEIIPVLQQSAWLTLDVEGGVAMVPVSHISTVFVVEDVPAAPEGTQES